MHDCHIKLPLRTLHKLKGNLDILDRFGVSVRCKRECGEKVGPRLSHAEAKAYAATDTSTSDRCLAKSATHRTTRLILPMVLRAPELVMTTMFEVSETRPGRML